MSRPIDRRGAPRYPVVANEIVLAWHEDSGHRQVPGELLNLSQAGALLRVQGLPTSPQRAWIRLVKPAETNWSECQLIATKPGLLSRFQGRGSCLVRLRFQETCPYDFFKLSTHGSTLEKAFQEPRTSEYECGVWR